MPNVAPNGLHARSGSAWKQPLNVYARVAQSWELADFVWAYHDDAWHIIWARVLVAPASATATWEPDATIRIDWVEPAVNPNTQWIVRRSDNSVVGTVPVGTTTIVDSRPLLATTASGSSNVSPYTIEGSNGSTSSAKLSTNAVSYNLRPATLTSSITYPTSTGSEVTLNWTPNATYGRPQGWRVWDNTPSGGAWRSDVLPGTTTTFVHDMSTAGWRGRVRDYQVFPFTQLPNGTWVQAGSSPATTIQSKATEPNDVSLARYNQPTAGEASTRQVRLTWTESDSALTGYEVQTSTNGSSWSASSDDTTPVTFVAPGASTTMYARVRTLSDGGPSDWVEVGPRTPYPDEPANPPTNVTISKTSNVGELKLTWDHASGARTGYDVEAYDGGSWTNTGDVTSPSYYTFSGDSGTRSMRIRTLSAGGPSDFVTRNATPLWDSTPPSLPTNRSLQPESSYGRMVYRFKTSSSDNDKYSVRYRINNGSWVYPSALQNVNTGNSSSKAVVITTVANGGPTSGTEIEAQVKVIDEVGNDSSWSSSSTYDVYPSPMTFLPNSTTGWRQDDFNYANQMYCGYFTNVAYIYFGYAFFGTGLRSFCSHGARTLTDVKATIARDTSGGNNVQDGVYIGWHALANSPGSGPAQAINDAGWTMSLAWGDAKEASVQNGVLNALSSGAAYGIGISPPGGKPYMAFEPKSAYSNQARLRVYHLG